MIFSATRFSRGDQRIARAGSSSISVRRSRTKQRRPFVTTFAAGICLGAVTKLSKTCHGCSIRSSGAGSNITGDTIARHSIRRCEHWIEILPFGLSGNTRSCATICAERHTGSPASRGVIQNCLLTGTWGWGVAPWWELYESRGSRTVLREAGAAMPRPTHRVITCKSAAEARAAVDAASRVLKQLDVVLHPQKTRIVHVRDG